MSLPEDVAFEVRKEKWSSYDLGEDIILKTKLVLLKILKPPGIPFRDIRELAFQTRPLFVIYAPLEKKGAPETRPITQDLIRESIIEDIEPKPIEENVNEYVLQDGTVLKLRLILVRVSKTSLFGADGSPIYAIQHQIVPQILSSYRRRPSRRRLGIE